MTTETTPVLIIAVCTQCLCGIPEGTPWLGIRHLCGGRIRSLVQPVPLDKFNDLGQDQRLDLKLKGF